MSQSSLRMRWVAFAVAALCLILSTAPAHAQHGTWTDVTAIAGTPVPLREYGSIFDRRNQQYLMFNGFSNSTGPYLLFNDVWSLSVAGTPYWSHVNITGTLPGERHSPQWGYDAARNRVLIFGGYGRHYPGDPFAYLNDVWQLSLDGTPQWTEIFPAGTPPTGRLAGAAVFDPMRQRFVGFGGTVGVPVDTWVLRLHGQPHWLPLPIPGPRPNGGWGMTSAYDAKKDRMLIFGGSTGDGYYGSKNEVWELDLRGQPQWSFVATQGTAPPPRRSATAIFDPIRNRMVIYGGFDAVPDSDDFLDDAWALDFDTTPPTWSRLLPAGTTPTGRDVMAAAYDPIHDRMIVYGGWSGTSMLGDTQFLDWGESSVEATLTPQAEATPTAAHLEWNVVSATGTYAAVYRRDSGGLWTAHGEGEVGPNGKLVYDDSSVQAGSAYSYMMVVGSQRGETFGGETTVQIPSTVGVEPSITNGSLALTRISPNPAVDHMQVSFALASDARATLELLDVMGRRWLDREVGSLGPGTHEINLRSEGQLPAGLYFLRLTQDGRVASSRVAIAGSR